MAAPLMPGVRAVSRDDGWAGVIDGLLYDDTGRLSAVVVHRDDGTWLNVPVPETEFETEWLH